MGTHVIAHNNKVLIDEFDRERFITILFSNNKNIYIYHDPISLMLEHQLMPKKQLKFRVKAQPNKHTKKK